jgi:hypothetical protein
MRENRLRWCEVHVIRQEETNEVKVVMKIKVKR